MQVNRIGIIGAGQMGNGIAHVMALAGYDVVLNDIDQTALDRAETVIGKNLDRQIRKKIITEADRDAALARHFQDRGRGGCRKGGSGH